MLSLFLVTYHSCPVVQKKYLLKLEHPRRACARAVGPSQVAPLPPSRAFHSFVRPISIVRRRLSVPDALASPNRRSSASLSPCPPSPPSADAPLVLLLLTRHLATPQEQLTTAHVRCRRATRAPVALAHRLGADSGRQLGGGDAGGGRAGAG